MLALRLVLSDEPSTLVFDEVDAGIGGAAAVAVARALGRLGRHHQVFVVTHLAQVAAAADRHLVVEKSVADGATTATVTAVAADARVTELARMLSGSPEAAVAREHAAAMLAASRSAADGIDA
jgi:DNA repair protein RecN (Recombination protein N)